MSKLSEKYEQYRDSLNYMTEYSGAVNASSGSKYDPNANVENKNVATMAGEIPKKTMIGINRLRLHDTITELFGAEMADQYLDDLENHKIYVHDETSIYPYCCSITMFPFLHKGLTGIGGVSTAPTNIDSFCGSYINLVFAVSSQFAGACSTPELLMYMDYFLRKDYGDDYYLNPEKVVDLSARHRTIQKVIVDYFEQIVYTINQPAAARNFQSAFVNIAYFDKPYFEGMFGDFLFPDGSEPKWESVSWLQKFFITWFNRERTKNVLTFPVETMNLLDDGEKFVDEEYADFTAEAWSKGHSFFLYRSDSVDSLASCCYSGDTKVLVKDENGAYLIPIRDVENLPRTTNGYRVFNNGKWSEAKFVKLPSRKMYEVTTSTNKKMIVTDNHRNNCLGGMKLTSELTTDDYIMCSSAVLDTYPEKDEHLTYEMGFAVGAFLGDGSLGGDRQLANGEHKIYEVSYSISEPKKWIIDIINVANKQLGGECTCKIGNTKENENLVPVRISSKELADFIIRWTNWERGTHASNKEVNMNCVLQSIDFRQGIVDGWFATDGNMNSIKPGYSLRGYSSSKKLIECIETICTTLGYITSVNVDTRRESPVFRGVEFNKNYDVYILLRYAKNKQIRYERDKCVFRDNSTYVRIKSVNEVEYDDEYVYCFEMEDTTDDKFTLPNGIHNFNCRLRNAVQDNTFSFTLGAGGVATGSKKVITINVNRLVQNATREGRDISDAVTEMVKRVHKYLLAYNKIYEDYFKAKLLPIYEAGFIALDKQYLTVGLNGFVEGAEFLGIEPTPNEKYFEYARKIMKPIYDENRAARTSDVMFNTEMVPAESLGVKNAKWDKRDGYFVPRDVYGSYFYRAEDDKLSVLDKIKLHGESTTKYLDGGSALHMNLDEHLTKSQYRTLMNYAVKMKCPYLTFNIPNTICNDCGYISKHIFDKCPICGSTNHDYITRIIGYLKRISSFSKPRQAEAERRYYHNADKELKEYAGNGEKSK